MKSQKEFESTLSQLVKRLEEKGDRLIFSFPVNLDRRGEIWDGAVFFGALVLLGGFSHPTTSLRR